MSILLPCFTKKANSIHILVIVDTSTSYVLVISFTEYQHGWLKCLNIRYVSEAQFFERQTVRILMNFVRRVNILNFRKNLVNSARFRNLCY